MKHLGGAGIKLLQGPPILWWLMYIWKGYKQSLVQTKLIYSKSVGYRNRMFLAVDTLLKEIRLIPLSLLSDLNAKSQLRPHLFSSAVSLRTTPEWRRFEGQEDRMQQTTWGRKKKGIASGFDSFRVMLRLLEAWSLFFSHTASNAWEVGAVKCVRWHDIQAKRKAEVWNSFFSDL